MIRARQRAAAFNFSVVKADNAINFSNKRKGQKNVV
jgi:hypothetical protein